MNRTLWVWQFDQFEPLWGQPPYGQRIADQGFNRICIKALDGQTWMSQFDPNPDAVSSLDDLEQRLHAFNNVGLAMDVWVNPTASTWRQAIPIYKDILAAVPGRLVLDLEPYEGFWGGETDVTEFMRALPYSSRLHLCYDPRRVDWLKSWYSTFAGTMPMIYDPAWLSDVPDRTGVPMEPIISSDNSGKDWLTILRDSRLASEDGRTGFGVWRAPLLGLERIATLQGIA